MGASIHDDQVSRRAGFRQRSDPRLITPARPGALMAQRASRRRILVLLLENVDLQDMAGPVQVFSEADALEGHYAISFHAISPHLRSAQGPLLADLLPLPQARKGDLVLVPGTDPRPVTELPESAARWLREALAAGAYIASTRGGVFALALAGILDNRRCTTHWKLVKLLRSSVHSADVIENRLFVRDGDVWTSAGAAAGIDLALDIVEDFDGPRVAAKVARAMIVHLRRSGDRPQTSIYVDHRDHLNPAVHRAQEYLVAHPERTVGLDELARLAQVSQRQLTRVFRRLTGVSVGQFAASVRAQLAADLLSDSDLTIEAIARRCGFQDSRQLRRLFRHVHGTTPAVFRERRKRTSSGYPEKGRLLLPHPTTIAVVARRVENG